MTAQETIEQLVKEFDELPGWEERYAMIISISEKWKVKSEKSGDEWHIDVYKVKGCQSQVWLYPSFDGEKIHFLADSDAVIVRGLIGILMKIYNHRTPDEILGVNRDFVQRLGLDQHLSVSRANGLASMMKQILLYAVAYKAKGALA